MSRTPSEKESAAIQSAFEDCGFGDISIVDGLKNVSLDGYEDGLLHFVGTCFAESVGDESSFRVSFHCLLDSESKVRSAYAYDVRSGNEIAVLAA